MQVYLALYANKDGNKHFLLGYKNEYYDEESKQQEKKLNGANKYCFPGGKLKPNEDIVAGAKREFKEETGCALENEHKQTTTVISKDNERYAVVFVEVSYENLEQINNNATTILNSPNRAYTVDNELAHLKICSEIDAQEMFKEGGNDTDWFYEAIDTFKKSKEVK